MEGEAGERGRQWAQGRDARGGQEEAFDGVRPGERRADLRNLKGHLWWLS